MKTSIYLKDGRVYYYSNGGTLTEGRVLGALNKKGLDPENVADFYRVEKSGHPIPIGRKELVEALSNLGEWQPAHKGHYYSNHNLKIDRFKVAANMIRNSGVKDRLLVETVVNALGWYFSGGETPLKCAPIKESDWPKLSLPKKILRIAHTCQETATNLVFNVATLEDVVPMAEMHNPPNWSQVGFSQQLSNEVVLSLIGDKKFASTLCGKQTIRRWGLSGHTVADDWKLVGQMAFMVEV